jgi:hypothetical protein
VTLPNLTWQHVVAILILSAMLFFMAWQSPLVTVLVLWLAREAFSDKLNKLLK